MSEALICDAVRTPIGKFGGSLSGIRTDDLAAIPIRAILNRNPQLDPARIDEVVLGCANQAGEDNRNVARMALLLAEIPFAVPGVTVNRLCASGLEAVASAGRRIRNGEAEMVIAGGVESMSRSPMVLAKATSAFDRNAEIYDTTIGWRFVNPKMKNRFGVDSMPETAENLVDQYSISREDQDAFARWSQEKASQAQEDGSLARELTSVSIPQRKTEPIIFDQDEHPRLSSLEQLAKLKTPFRENGTITAGNASGVNDGSAALIVASENAVKEFGLNPLARVVGAASAGVEPRVMGIGPVSSTEKLLERLNLQLDDFDILELNEAFAAQVLACTRQLKLEDNDPRINPLGGAIALGHPLGMSGARLATTAVHQFKNSDSSLALCSMCVGVGQGMSMVLESV